MSTTSPTTPSNIYPCLFYDDAPAAIEFLERAFGFERKLIVPGPDETVTHAELTLGPGVIMVSSARPEKRWVSPQSLPALNQVLSIRVDDPDAHFERARGGGARIIQELADEEYGSRGYMAEDPEGNVWYFGTYRPGSHW